MTMLSRCPHLGPQITANDKTPFTDGHVEVYDGLAKTKSDWRGRVSVQVKGRSRRGKLNSFPIPRVDLLGYQRESGVVYFVVLVDKAGKTTPYYALLAPFRIQALLDGADEEQDNISVPMEKFPSSPALIEPIFGLALRTKNQNPSMGFDPAMFEQVRTLTVHSISGMSLDAPLVLDPLRGDYALEVVTENGMTVPLGGTLEIHPRSYVPTRTEVRISCGDATYDNFLIRRLDEHRVEIALAGGLKLILRESETERSGSFTLQLESNFASRLKAVEFFIALTERHPLRIGELEENFVDAEMDKAELKDAKSLHDQWKMLQRLRDLFDVLHIDPTLIEMKDLDDEQIRQLLQLYHALVHEEEATNEDGETSRFVVNVGSWHLMVLVLPGTGPHRWKYVDPFDPAAPHMYRYSPDMPEEEGIPITVYDAVEEEYLPSLLNLRLDAIVDAYAALSDQPRTTHLANERVIALIKAADRQPKRQPELLDAASRLNDWLIAQDGPLDRHVVNRAQIRWRTDSLTAEDRNSVRIIKRSSAQAGGEDGVEFEFACALILDEVEEAAYLRSQLSDAQVEKMSAWPIWHLHEPAALATTSAT
ncbi:hypothetical protein [Microbacterium sp. BF1]|uniref:hypothetical protein n=1 Tax=Microbacterium sp. BF1 TaxID=2821146 RepID=UPI001C4E1B87|nr:hypothetical protein [Microbacterium sp. BF1]